MTNCNVLTLPTGYFLGDTLRAGQVSGFRLTETFYPIGMSQPDHVHESSLYCFVLSGTYLERVGGRERTRDPISLTFYPAGSSHAETYRMPGRHLLVELNSEWIDCARDGGVQLDDPTELQIGSTTWLLMKVYREFLQLESDSQMALETLMVDLLDQTCRPARKSDETRAPRWLRDATDLLHSRFAENLGLREVAATVNIHAVHLARVFRKFNNCTIGDYVRGLRVKHAARRISGSTDSLAEIALEAGFADQSHLSRTFKQHTGMWPGQFRTLLRR